MAGVAAQPYFGYIVPEEDAKMTVLARRLRVDTDHLVGVNRDWLNGASRGRRGAEGSNGNDNGDDDDDDDDGGGGGCYKNSNEADKGGDSGRGRGRGRGRERKASADSLRWGRRRGGRHGGGGAALTRYSKLASGTLIRLPDTPGAFPYDP